MANRNRNGRYITKNLTKKSPETIPYSSLGFTLKSLAENKIVKILAAAIYSIFCIWFGYYLTTRKTVEASLTLKIIFMREKHQNIVFTQ